MAFSTHEILKTFPDGRRWAAHLRFDGTHEAVLRFGETEPSEPEINAAAAKWIMRANATEARRGNKFNKRAVAERLVNHWQAIRRQIIDYCVANPACTPVQMVAHLSTTFPASLFNWPNLFAALQQVLDIPSFAAMRDYIVANAASADEN